MRKLKNVTVLGAGTAGWISAYILSDFFSANKLDIKVTIIDPSSIPIIGVGEGTTGIFYDFLNFIQIKLSTNNILLGKLFITSLIPRLI